MGNILAMGAVDDAKAFRAVSAALADLGHKAVLFEQDKCLSGELITVEASEKRFDVSIRIGGEYYPLRIFDAVWCMAPIVDDRLLGFKPERYRDYLSDQFHGMRQGIFYLMRDAPWINEPWCSAKAEVKISQLEKARRLGFVIPPTIITSDPDRIRDFWHAWGGRIITKQLKQRPIYNEPIFTSRVSAEDLASADSMLMSPAIFQAEIAKLYELRVAMFGSEAFIAELHSQSDPETALDWRAKPRVVTPMSPGSLPADLVERLHEMLDEFGLQSGSFDLIYTPEGEYVFLELNPNGQWYFVQQATGLPLADAMARLLSASLE